MKGEDVIPLSLPGNREPTGGMEKAKALPFAGGNETDQKPGCTARNSLSARATGSYLLVRYCPRPQDYRSNGTEVARYYISTCFMSLHVSCSMCVVVDKVKYE